MNNNKITYIFLGTILIVMIGIFVVSLQPEIQPIVNVSVPQQKLGGIEDLTRIGDGVSVASTSVSTNATGTEILASASHIAYRRLQNTGLNVLTCNLDSATSTIKWKEGIVLSTSGADSIWEQYLGYWGAIRCMSTTSAGIISTVQY